jgi:hypothetical protein
MKTKLMITSSSLLKTLRSCLLPFFRMLRLMLLLINWLLSMQIFLFVKMFLFVKTYPLKMLVH